MAAIGARVEPAAIDSDHELRVMRGLIDASDDSLCRKQSNVQRWWRRASLRLALEYTRANGVVEDDFPFEFRWGCSTALLQNGEPWKLSGELNVVRDAWAAYHRNDVLGMALGALLDVALDLLDDGAVAPRPLARSIVDLAASKVKVGESSMAALNGTASQWVESCRQDARLAREEPWGTGSTWELWEALADTPATDRTRTAGLAVRLLGRLATDTGGFEKTGFSTFPSGAAVAHAYDVHLGSWLARVKERGDTPIRGFLEDLVVEWVLFRHLRVATRKLANQGISTFHFRPEDGALVRIVAKLPEKGLTSPRLRQLHQYLRDLRYLESSPDGTELTEDGAKLLEESSS